MKKYLSVVILMLIAFSAIMIVNAAIPSDVYGTRLETGYVSQQKSNWCWAASAENAIIWEMSPTRDQADAVRKIKGSLFNPYPDVTGSLEDICNAAEYISNNTKTYIGVHEAKSFSFISEHIYNRHPIIACVGYYNNAGARTGGHAILVMGWDTSTGVQEIKYFDPEIGTHVICPYAGFCDGTFNNRKYDKTSYHS